jgi:transposase-like protein
MGPTDGREPVRCPQCDSERTIRTGEQSLTRDSYYCLHCRSGFDIQRSVERRVGLKDRRRAENR